MNDPDRLLESKSSPLSRALLGSLKNDAPSRASKKRALAGAALAATAVQAGHSAATTGTMLLLAKWTAAGALLGGVASGGVVVLHDAKEAPQTATPTVPTVRHTGAAPPAARVVPKVGGLPAAPEVPAPELKTPRGAVAAHMATAPSGSGAALPTTLREQRLAIDRARRHLAKGDNTGVLRELDRYEASHRRQFFAQEAMVLRIEALTRLQQTSRAQNLGRRFLKVYPDSPLAKRVRSLIGDP